jgi:hypothetical protein
MTAQMATLSQELAAAIAAEDPAALAAALTQVNQLATQLEANTAALSAAVTANTPAAPAPTPAAPAAPAASARLRLPLRRNRWREDAAEQEYPGKCYCPGKSGLHQARTAA